MKGAVLTFPGSNNDSDCLYTLKEVFECPVDSIWHKDQPDLCSYDLVWIPGGFSYGDYLRCGAMASVSPVMKSVREYVKKGGYVIGTCNGFQILCESGILPGALVRNQGLRFICKDVALKVSTNESFFTETLNEGDILNLPIAHGEGRYVADEKTIKELNSGDRVLFRYCDNPNGSVDSIAGILSENRKVVGLMPHPERATKLRSGDGEKIWRSVFQSLSRGWS